VHTRAFAAALPADDGDGSGFMSSDQKTAELDESAHAIFGCFAFLHH